MADLQAQIKTARAAGYSDEDIIKHLGSTDARVKTAIDAGYKPDEILGHLQSQAPASIPGIEKLGTLPGVPVVPQTGRQAGAARVLGAAPDFNPNAGSFMDDYVIEPGMRGLRRAGEGIAAMSRPGADDKFSAAGDVISGVGEAASPYMAAGALANPMTAIRAGIRGGIGTAVGATAAHVIAPDSPGFQSFASKAGGVIGAGTTKPVALVSNSEVPNAMGGEQFSTLPEMTELLPFGLGKAAKVYNMGAKAVNKVNGPKVEQVRGSLHVPSMAGYPKPEMPLVEQVRGSHSLPSTAGYPQPQVEVPPVTQVPGSPAPIPANHPLAKVQDLGPEAAIEKPPGGSWGKGYRATKAPQVEAPGVPPVPPVTQVPGKMLPVDTSHPLAKVSEPGAPVEQVRGSLRVPSIAGYPQQAEGVGVSAGTTPQVPPVSNGTGTGNGGVGRVYDWYTKGHGGHQQAIDIELNGRFKGVNPDTITVDQMNAARIARAKSKGQNRPEDSAVKGSPAEIQERLDQFRKTLKAERAK